MQVSEISTRYAKALFDIATECNDRQSFFEDLRVVQQVFDGDKKIHEFIASGLIPSAEKKKILKDALDKAKVSESVQSFIFLLADRGRLQMFKQIVEAYQKTSDEAHGVTRGKVKSAKPLSEEEQKVVEARIAKVTGKKVILNYECDPSIIGGLIAEVGGYVFDDTIVTHLKRLKEDIQRRTH